MTLFTTEAYSHRHLRPDPSVTSATPATSVFELQIAHMMCIAPLETGVEAVAELWSDCEGMWNHIFQSTFRLGSPIFSLCSKCGVFAKLTLLGTVLGFVQRLVDHLRPRKMVVVVRVSLDGLHERIHDRVAIDRHFDDR